MRSIFRERGSAVVDTLVQIAILIAFVLAGMLASRLKLAPKPSVVDLIIKFVLWALLFSMGFRLGANRELFSKAGSMSLLALVVAASSVAGTILAIVALYKVAALFKRRSGAARRPSPGKSGMLSLGHLKGPLLLLLVVAVGLVAGLLVPVSKAIKFDTITSIILDALLFFIGMQLAYSGKALGSAFLRLDTILVPLGTILGTAAGGLVSAALFRLSPGKGLALSCGFGWYSLSGVLIAGMGDELLGMTAFIANMIREAIALLAIPVLAFSRYPFTAIGVGGATAMDVTLPLIEQSLGVEAVPVSFASGVMLSLLVPVLVPFFYSI